MMQLDFQMSHEKKPWLVALYKGLYYPCSYIGIIINHYFWIPIKPPVFHGMSRPGFHHCSIETSMISGGKSIPRDIPNWSNRMDVCTRMPSVPPPQLEMIFFFKDETSPLKFTCDRVESKLPWHFHIIGVGKLNPTIYPWNKDSRH